MARLVVVENLTVPNYERQIQIIDGEDGPVKGTRLAQVLAAMKVLK
ncbi:MAG: hypothetical protein Q7W38_08905 [Deltaproteobacteria bacterium]|nr:hypothetical protein [Deltaproteobacteria bacterium]